MQFFCCLTGILCCRMALFIRMENIRLCIQAKGLVQQPIAVFRICFFTFPIRFIAAASQTLSVRQGNLKSKLLRLCRLNIKEGNRIALNFSCFTICHSDKMNTVSGILGLLFT